MNEAWHTPIVPVVTVLRCASGPAGASIPRRTTGSAADTTATTRTRTAQGIARSAATRGAGRESLGLDVGGRPEDADGPVPESGRGHAGREVGVSDDVRERGLGADRRSSGLVRGHESGLAPVPDARRGPGLHGGLNVTVASKVNPANMSQHPCWRAGDQHAVGPWLQFCPKCRTWTCVLHESGRHLACLQALLAGAG